MEMEMGIMGGYIEPSPGVSNPSIQLPSSRSLAELMGLPGGWSKEANPEPVIKKRCLCVRGKTQPPFCHPLVVIS